MTTAANTPQSSPAGRVPELILPPGERVILSRRPSPWIILLRPAGWYLMMLLALAAAWSAGRTFLADLWGLLLGLWWLLVLLRLCWDSLSFIFRRHVLTDRRIVRSSGVLRRAIADLPLEKVQYLAIDRSLRQRLFGLGTISAGVSSLAMPEVVWPYMARSDQLAREIRAAIDAAGGPGGRTAGAAGVGQVSVVGLVGGIGSGKSTVARELAARGCRVIDSDATAREILLRPPVRDELVRWWGAGITDSAGQIDRSQVARIVFADPAQRARLEALVHPLIHQDRAAIIQRVRESGGGIVVIDAPLLFEAGVDAECDAVVFVDAPRAVRLDRVRSRGWNEQELDRRERAQMPLEEKRRRSGPVIDNAGDLESLERQVRGLVESWRREPPHRKQL